MGVFSYGAACFFVFPWLLVVGIGIVVSIGIVVVLLVATLHNGIVDDAFECVVV